MPWPCIALDLAEIWTVAVLLRETRGHTQPKAERALHCVAKQRQTAFIVSLRSLSERLASLDLLLFARPWAHASQPLSPTPFHSPHPRTVTRTSLSPLAAAERV